MGKSEVSSKATSKSPEHSKGEKTSKSASSGQNLISHGEFVIAQPNRKSTVGSTQPVQGGSRDTNKDGCTQEVNKAEAQQANARIKSSSGNKDMAGTEQNRSTEYANVLANLTVALTSMSKNFDNLGTSIGTGFDKMASAMQEANQEWQEFPDHEYSQGEDSDDENEIERAPVLVTS